MQLPSTGGTSFLRLTLLLSPQWTACVNALYGQGLISTQILVPALRTGMEGVNALYGRHLISTAIISDFFAMLNVCQCPLRAAPHFYATPLKTRISMRCVNALYGRDLISTNEKSQSILHHRACQCPLRTGPHFYSSLFSLLLPYYFCVNALYGRDLISTCQELSDSWRYNYGVNALYGRDLISTIFRIHSNGNA